MKIIFQNAEFSFLRTKNVEIDFTENHYMYFSNSGVVQSSGVGKRFIAYVPCSIGDKIRIVASFASNVYTAEGSVWGEMASVPAVSGVATRYNTYSGNSFDQEITVQSNGYLCFSVYDNTILNSLKFYKNME